MKRCRKCGETKPLDDFYRQRDTTDGHKYCCKVCTNADQRARWAVKGKQYYQNSTRIIKLAERRAALAARFGERCAICGTTEPSGHGTWHLDHDHSCCPGDAAHACGKCDRGLLCLPCNTRLGVLENEEFVQQARAYLAAVA